MSHQSFYWGTKVTLLFESLETMNAGWYVVALIGAFTIAFFYEWLLTLEYPAALGSSVVESLPVGSVDNVGEETPLLLSIQWEKLKVSHMNMPFSPRAYLLRIVRILKVALLTFGGSLFHDFKMVASYTLMMLVMTYNVGLFLSILAGAGAGHQFFRKTPTS